MPRVTGDDAVVLGLDHTVIACRDLGRSAERFRRWGFSVEPGGRHEGLGTVNALVRLRAGYLELLSVEDEQVALAAGPSRRALVEVLRAREETLAGFALTVRGIDRLAARLRLARIPCAGPTPMRRVLPDGRSLDWSVVIADAAPWRRPFPFFIEWGDGSRPERGDPQPNGVIDVARIVVRAARVDEAVDLCRAAGVAPPDGAGELPLADGARLEIVLAAGDGEGIAEVRLATASGALALRAGAGGLTLAPV